ncbi:MAG: aconitase X [Granulosicoccus sp.]
MCDVALSFWGGVHPQTGVIVDAHHPQCGESVAGRVVMMPSSRGSCTGSAVLLGLALTGKAPAAFVFREAEDVLTLGAVVSNTLYGSSIAVIRLDEQSYGKVAQESLAQVQNNILIAGDISIPLRHLEESSLRLSSRDQKMLDGDEGKALQIAMSTICTMGRVHNAQSLIDITRVHIDGCIYASPANLTFAQTVRQHGGQVCVPTTMNAISVDYANWRKQGIADDFGMPAQALADAYVAMGAEPSFTCAPYLRADKPVLGEPVAWAESNAVVYANSVLGARTNKHPDFLDLFIALTGRAPDVGMYEVESRQPSLVINVEWLPGADESFWPLLGWISGQLSPEGIPLLRGLSDSQPGDDDLKALCAAFGTTSGAPMLHIEGITPEAAAFADCSLPDSLVCRDDFHRAWSKFNRSQQAVDLIALGSPHLSAKECLLFAQLMEGRSIAEEVDVIMTIGRDILNEVEQSGVLAQLEALGAQIVPDICWCSISRPLFPVNARTVMTNSGKYAHYGPGLSGCEVLFGSLSDCADTATTGRPPDTPPQWMG